MCSGTSAPEETLQSAAQCKARLRELRALVAEREREEAAKRGQVAARASDDRAILKRKRVHDLRGLCGELAVEASGAKAQMIERIVAARLQQEPTTEADAPAEPPAAEPLGSGTTNGDASAARLIRLTRSRVGRGSPRLGHSQGHKAEGHKVEGHKAEAHKIEGHKAEAHKAEAHAGHNRPGSQGQRSQGWIHKANGHTRRKLTRPRVTKAGA